MLYNKERGVVEHLSSIMRLIKDNNEKSYYFEQ